MTETNRPRILITGGSGFIGTNAVTYFAEHGYDVLSIDKKPPMNPQHQDIWREVDILDHDLLVSTFKAFAPDYLLHLAARTDLKETQSIDGYRTNTDGVKNILGALKVTESIQRVIFASSRMVCKIGYQPKDEFDVCPPSPYGESKVIGERLVRDAGIDAEWLIIRPTSIWGPWFDVPYRIFFDMIQKGYYAHIMNHNPRKSFGFVGNTVYQLHKLLLADSELVNGKTTYLADYPPLQLKEWSLLIAKEMGKTIYTLPMAPLRMAASVGDLFYMLGWYRVPLTNFRLNNIITEMVYETPLLEKAVGALPLDLTTGVRATVKWMHEFS